MKTAVDQKSLNRLNVYVGEIIKTINGRNIKYIQMFKISSRDKITKHVDYLHFKQLSSKF